MRLLNVDTLEIKTYNEHDVPPYAILSHTWGPDEVTFQEICMITRMRSVSQALSSRATSNISDGSEHSGTMLAVMEMLAQGTWGASLGIPNTDEDALMRREGYRKIVYSANEARRLGYSWIWIDTCCIDKTSSAELQESINSMYKWYKGSGVCLVYLEDTMREMIVNSQLAPRAVINPFQDCRWISRGWTLQELVAPTSLRFYYKDWTLMGDKRDFLEELYEATYIPIFVLDTGDLSELSVAQRMSWASYRQTTRVEDSAYCLLGIFDIQMPLLYGEGPKAFIRLQEEILKTTDDYSLFAWQAVSTYSQPVLKSVYRGLFARSPLEFCYCRFVERDNTTSTFPISATTIGLHLQFELLIDQTDKTRFLAFIRCNGAMNRRLAIYLKCLDGGSQYARVDAGSIIPVSNWPSNSPIGQRRSIYVRQKLHIPRLFYTSEMCCFAVRRRVSKQSLPPPVRVTSAFPSSLWNQQTQELAIPPDTPEVIGVLNLRARALNGTDTDFQVIVGFNRKTSYYWCTTVQRVWPDVSDDPARWHAAIKEALPEHIKNPRDTKSAKHDILVSGFSGLGLNIGVRASLCGDQIALQVQIDGLMAGG